jgi:hypothetical protein
MDVDGQAPTHTAGTSAVPSAQVALTPFNHSPMTDRGRQIVARARAQHPHLVASTPTPTRDPSPSRVWTFMQAGTSVYAFYCTPGSLGAAAEDGGTATSLGLGAPGRAARGFDAAYAAIAAACGGTLHAGVGRAAARHVASADHLVIAGVARHAAAGRGDPGHGVAAATRGADGLAAAGHRAGSHTGLAAAGRVAIFIKLAVFGG